MPKLIQVIEGEITRGDGKSNPFRRLKAYYTLKGELLAVENDPTMERRWESLVLDAERRVEEADKRLADAKKPYDTFGAYMDKTRYILPTDHPWNKPYGPGTAAKEEYNYLKAVYDWCNTLPRDPTTRSPICDVCGDVRPSGLADGSLLEHWMKFHYTHPRPAVENKPPVCGEKYTDEDPARCDLAKGHVGAHKSGTFWWERNAEGVLSSQGVIPNERLALAKMSLAGTLYSFQHKHNLKNSEVREILMWAVTEKFGPPEN